jgi:hypothetical protein
MSSRRNLLYLLLQQPGDDAEFPLRTAVLTRSRPWP